LDEKEGLKNNLDQGRFEKIEENTKI